MSMSTRVVGFRPPDDRWQKMKAAWEACKQAGLDPPPEVQEFFNSEPPADRPGAEVDISAAVTPYEREGYDGFEVDVRRLPEGVHVIRFCISW